MKKLFTLLLLSVACLGFGQDLELLISRDEIVQKIKDVAVQIDEEYAGQDLVILSVMKGAICVTSDLILNLHVPFTIECIKASSYGKNGTKRGTLTVSGIENLDLASKHVLIVDDIFDTGNTMVGIINYVKEKHPKSIKSLVLLEKNIARETDYRPDYTLFHVEDLFVVGYGLDIKEYLRGLPGVYAIVEYPEDPL